MVLTACTRATFSGVETRVLSLALPLQSETHWPDMLAVLIATDPVPLGAVLGLHCDRAAGSVQREASLDSANRPDIVLTATGPSRRCTGDGLNIVAEEVEQQRQRRDVQRRPGSGQQDRTIMHTVGRLR